MLSAYLSVIGKIIEILLLDNVKMLNVIVNLINVVFGYLTFESNLLSFLLALINGHLRPFNTLHYKLLHEICWQAEKSCLVLGHQGVVLQKKQQSRAY